MKKSKPSRLLTPAAMATLAQTCQVRDQDCLMADHPTIRCSGTYDAHHILEQSWIKIAYGKRGGRLTSTDTGSGKGFYIPRALFDFDPPDISASQIAADPDICICLCRRHHDLWPQLSIAEKLKVIFWRKSAIDSAAVHYGLRWRLLRAYGETNWTDA